MSTNNYDLLLGKEARDKIIIGINKLANAVKVTLGPSGRTVVIKRENERLNTTKDGVTVAQNVILLDPIENMGAMMIREAAAKTAERAGDGTTTATVLAQGLIQIGIELTNKENSPVIIKKRWDELAEKTLEILSKYVDKDVTKEKLVQIATIASNNSPSLGKLIGEAVFDIGKHGIVSIAESSSIETYVDMVRGAQINAGFTSPYFVNAPKIASAVYDKCHILLIHGKLFSLNEIQNALDNFHNKRQPILIIANDYDLRVQTILVENYISNGWQGVCVKTPKPIRYQLACLQDIAATTGGRVIECDRESLANLKPSDIGFAEKIEVNEVHTTIVGGHGKKEVIDQLVSEIQTEIGKTVSSVERDFAKARLTRLLGGVAVINVGASTDLELREKKDRVDDAKQACKAALAEGILPGAGYPLGRAALEIREQLSEDDEIGIAFCSCLLLPLSTIQKNADYPNTIPLVLDESGVKVLQRLFHYSYSVGINSLTGQECDLIQEGIIDPFKVIKEALLNGVSVATMILLTEALLYRQFVIKTPLGNPLNTVQS